MRCGPQSAEKPIRFLPVHAPHIPQHLKVIIEAEALIIGTSQAYEPIGFSAKPQELNQAILTALTNAI